MLFQIKSISWQAGVEILGCEISRSASGLLRVLAQGTLAYGEPVGDRAPTNLDSTHQNLVRDLRPEVLGVRLDSVVAVVHL